MQKANYEGLNRQVDFRQMQQGEGGGDLKGRSRLYPAENKVEKKVPGSPWLSSTFAQGFPGSIPKGSMSLEPEFSTILQICW
jgi:hypothetical protein